MAYTDFFCDAAGSNINAGDDKTVVTSVNGDWGNAAANRFTAAAGTPFSGVAVNDFASIYLDGATTAVYVARVTAVNAGGASLTLSASIKAGTAPTTGATGRSCTVGGKWKGPNGAEGFPFNFADSTLALSSSTPVRVNFKNGSSYNITAAITHNSTGPVTFQGYASAVGDGGKFTIDGGTSGASYVPLTFSTSSNILIDAIITNNGSTGSASGLAMGTAGTSIKRVVVHDVCGVGIDHTATGLVEECEAYACNQNNTANLGGFRTTEEMSYLRCVSHDNVGSNSSGFVLSSTSSEPVTLIDCIADTNGADGIRTTTTAMVLVQGGVFHNNTSDGIDLTANGQVFVVVQNAAFVSNGAYGLAATASTSGFCFASNCAFYNNTSGQTNGTVADRITGSITLTGDPFVDAANGDFDLNNTSGAGAACRGAGRGAFTQTAASYTGTLSVPDVGASQHADAGGGGSISGARIFTGF